MIRVALAVIITLLILAVFAADVPQTSKAAGIEVRSQNTTNRFPNGVQFSIFLSTEAPITSARLRATVLPDRPIAFVRATCTAGTAPTCNATLGESQDSYMVPGAEIRYVWEIEDQNGNKLETPEASATYMDDRFQWQSVTEDGLTVYYYFGNDETPRNVLRTSRETIDRISALLDTTLDFPVKIWVYRTAADMAPAVASTAGRGPNSTVRTLGEVGAADTALVSRDVDFLNIVRHELAHVVTGRATRSHINFPSWINEGISVYAQREILPDEQAAMDVAIRRNEMLPISSLGSSARGTAGTVSLFYGQSGSIVKYMIETYGDEKFAQWVAATRTQTIDDALKAVYDFDTLGLENGWRASLGLPEVTGSGTGSSTSPSTIPTLPPLGANPSSGSSATPTPAGQNTGNPSTGAPATEDDDGGSSSPLPFFLAGVAVLVLGSGAGLLILKKRGSAPSA